MVEQSAVREVNSLSGSQEISAYNDTHRFSQEPVTGLYPDSVKPNQILTRLHWTPNTETQ